MTSIFLQGISLENFRGIGSREFVGPFQDINFFVGPNNVGKSTILHFLSTYARPNKKGLDLWNREFAPVDARLGKNLSEVRFSFGFSADGAVEKVLALSKDRYEDDIQKLIAMLTTKNGLLWVEPDEGRRAAKFYSKGVDFDALEQARWHRLWQAVTGRQGGSVGHWRAELLQALASSLAPAYPEVHLVPAIREVSASGVAFTDYSGRGLIDKLAELQNPPHDERQLREKFNRINRFLAAVTECEDATIEVPHDRRYLLVHMDGKVLPLSSLGTGIHEVVMIASFCTLLEEKIVCVEEPEIHLHPLLQRKLIRYLRENTKNQYFIATHSASVVDAVPASIFRVENKDGEARIALCVTPSERYDVCKALGYRASDLLQSNVVVWVEGPSDRIYLNHWLKAAASDLVEGIDYSIMFYGGRLLSHLSADDVEISEFISLRKLNRNVAVVMDSDKAKAGSPLNATKKRVADELSDSFSWVTNGREIENYVPAGFIAKALAAEYPRFGRLKSDGRYDRRLVFLEAGTNKEIDRVDKVKIAMRVSKMEADLDQLDLKKKISALVAFIREAAHPK